MTGRRANGSGLVERAHERSLVVHAYTFRNEVQRVPTVPQASS